VSMAARIVGIVDVGVSNLASVRHAFERLGAKVHVAREPEDLAQATHVVLPGVGAARPGMRALRERGFDRALSDLDRPLLGICLGMQLLFEESEEGGTECLGLLPGRVHALAPAPGVRVPHMGWNALVPRRGDALLDGLPADAQVYFVHGFAAPIDAACVASAVHGASFAAIVRRGTLCGTQFHPERSGAIGARVLHNFLEIA